MTLLQNIVNRWKTIPTPSPLPRLENHLIHMLAGYAFVSFLMIFDVDWFSAGWLLFWFVCLRETIQTSFQRQVVWVSLFDVFQYNFHWVIYLLFLQQYLLFVLTFITYVIIYILFLIKDNKWFYD